MRHVGDLGNIEVHLGAAKIDMSATLPTLFEGANNVISCVAQSMLQKNNFKN